MKKIFNQMLTIPGCNKYQLYNNRIKDKNTQKTGLSTYAQDKPASTATLATLQCHGVLKFVNKS